MQFIDLFAGLGGFNLALSGLGHECVFASEIDETLRDIYRINFGLKPAGDIRNIPVEKVPPHQILCAGFPCQPFSKAGSQQGLNDGERGSLFYEILKIIDYHEPQYLLLENVPNIMRHNNGRTWEKIKKSLEYRGYVVKCADLSPHHFGIPQIRLRTYIVANKSPPYDFVWPERPSSENTSITSILDANPPGAQRISTRLEKCLDIWQEFLDQAPKEEKIPHPLWSMEFGATYPYKDTTPYALPYEDLTNYLGSFGQPLTGKSKREIMGQLPSHATRKQAHFPEWKIRMIERNRSYYKRNMDWIDDWKKKIRLFPTSYQKMEWNCQGEERKIRKYILQFRASGVRVKRLTTAPSLVAMTSTQVPVIGWESRFMTINECKKLQSMHGLYLPGSKKKAYEALGNAVNVQVVKAIASALIKSDKSEMIQCQKIARQLTFDHPSAYMQHTRGSAISPGLQYPSL
jgi:DNA (cytosine-5)-methyltransferase 1